MSYTNHLTKHGHDDRIAVMDNTNVVGVGVPKPLDNRITQVMVNYEEQLRAVHNVIAALHADLLSQPLACDEAFQCEPRSLQDFLADGPQWLNTRLMPIYNMAQELRDKLICPM